MIYKPANVHLRTMTSGIVAIFAVSLLLPTSSAVAAGDVHAVMRPTPSRIAPAHAHASRAAHPDPRVMQFNLELAAYKQTVAALRRDTQRLMAQQKRIDALVNEIGKNAELNMIQLQSIMSQRQTAIQLTSNLMKALNDSEQQIVHNMK